jgi:hypothetical protein
VVLPNIPSVATSVTTIMVAERIAATGAALVLADHQIGLMAGVLNRLSDEGLWLSFELCSLMVDLFRGT